MPGQTFTSLPSTTKTVHTTITTNKGTGGATSTSTAYSAANSDHNLLISLGLAILDVKTGALIPTHKGDWAIAFPNAPIPGSWAAV